MIVVLLDSWGKQSRIGDANRIRKWLESGAAPGRSSSRPSARTSSPGCRSRRRRFPPSISTTPPAAACSGDLPARRVLPDARRARAHARALGGHRALRRRGGCQLIEYGSGEGLKSAAADPRDAPLGVRAGRHFGRRAARRGASGWRALSPGCASRRWPATSRSRSRCRCGAARAERGLFPGLDHRQPHAARKRMRSCA